MALPTCTATSTRSSRSTSPCMPLPSRPASLTSTTASSSCPDRIQSAGIDPAEVEQALEHRSGCSAWAVTPICEPFLRAPPLRTSPPSSRSRSTATGCARRSRHVLANGHRRVGGCGTPGRARHHVRRRCSRGSRRARRLASRHRCRRGTTSLPSPTDGHEVRTIRSPYVLASFATTHYWWRARTPPPTIEATGEAPRQRLGSFAS